MSTLIFYVGAASTPRWVPGQSRRGRRSYEPLLIRRPLMECDGRRMAGFDTERVAAWIGAPLVREEHGDRQTCRRDAK